MAETATNPPFQRRIIYRPDDYSSLRFKLLEQLKAAFPRWNSQLAQNQVQQDMGVALAEMFAYLADILYFYQDCRANEAFLRSAVLPASLIELCALIDYRLAPGASASTLQVFILKPATKGLIPTGFRIKAAGKQGQPDLTFETDRDLDADAARNQLRLAGYDRSLRKLNQTNLPPDTTVLLDRGYDGLKAGGFLIFSVPGADYPVQLVAVTDQGDKRRITWQASALPSGANLPVADLVIQGKPKQSMFLAQKARADEITAGQHSARVSDPSVLSCNDHVIFVSEGFKQPARIIAKNGDLITWDRGFQTSLRRSQTRIYTGGHVGFAVAHSGLRIGSKSITSDNRDRRQAREGLHQELRIGSKSITSDNPYFPQPVPGDYLLISGPEGLEMAMVTAVSGNTYSLLEGLTRTFSSATLFKVRLDNEETGASGDPHTTLSPLRLASNATGLTLDKTYEGLEPGSAIVISDGESTKVNKVSSAQVDSEDRTTLTLMNQIGANFKIATTTIYGPFEQPMRVDGYNRAENNTPVGMTSMTLKGVVSGLKPGDYLVLEGGGKAEGVRISALSVSQGNSVVSLQSPTTSSYPVGATVIYGNVVPLSHGSLVVEQGLGSGDQSQANQRFTLHQSPTTFTQDAENPRGVANSLQVLLNDEQWQEVESLAESGPDDRHYMTEIDDEAKMSLVFGDGRHGARLPTGQNNVRVRYRVGLGVAGNVDAGTIVTPPQPLVFLDTTRNPLGGGGGADSDTPEEIRRIAPIIVRTLDRAVSLADYAYLALAYAGIAKACADWGWEGCERITQLTVASVGGKPLTPVLADALRGYLDARRAPRHRVRIRDYRPFPVRLSLEVTVLPNFLRAEAKRRVQQALGSGLTETGEKGYFHFDRRDLGQNLHLSEVYAIAEAIRGVDYVVAKAFHAESPAASPGTVLDSIKVPADAVATGGDPSDVATGILSVQAVGGLG